MTNREAVEAEVGIPGYEPISVTKAMVDLTIVETDTYTANNTDVLKAALSVLKIMLAIYSVTEGGYSITFAIKERIKQIEDELGIPDSGQPVITDMSWKW